MVSFLSRHWIFVSEYMYRVLQPTDSAQQITVADMKGVRIQVKTVEKTPYLYKPLLSKISWKDAVHPSCDALNNSRPFALGASNVCLVGENPTYFVPA